MKIRETQNKNIVTENELIQRVRTGDKKAYADLTLRYRTRLFAKALSFTGSIDDAEDIMQEALVKAYFKISTFKGDSQFFTWIYSILINEGRTFLKKKKKKEIITDFTVSDHYAYQEDKRENFMFDFSEGDFLDKCLELLLRMISGLPEKYSEILFFRYDLDHSYEEISSSLKINIGTVKSRINQAKELLRRSMTGSDC